MPHIVTIKSSAPAVVISERIVDDGRERHVNGTDVLEPDVEQSFIVHDKQSLRVVAVPAAIEVDEPTEVAVDESAPAAAAAPAEGAAA